MTCEKPAAGSKLDAALQEFFAGNPWSAKKFQKAKQGSSSNKASQGDWTDSRSYYIDRVADIVSKKYEGATTNKGRLEGLRRIAAELTKREFNPDVWEKAATPQIKYVIHSGVPPDQTPQNSAFQDGKTYPVPMFLTPIGSPARWTDEYFIGTETDYRTWAYGNQIDSHGYVWNTTSDVDYSVGIGPNSMHREMVICQTHWTWQLPKVSINLQPQQKNTIRHPPTNPIIAHIKTNRRIEYSHLINRAMLGLVVSCKIGNDGWNDLFTGLPVLRGKYRLDPKILSGPTFFSPGFHTQFVDFVIDTLIYVDINADMMLPTGHNMTKMTMCISPQPLRGRFDKGNDITGIDDVYTIDLYQFKGNLWT